MNTESLQNASLIRRIAAIIYDLLLLTGVLFAASAIAVAVNKGVAVTHPLYYLALILVTFGFYGWFWTHGGQTLGLRTWRLKVVRSNGEKLTWRDAAVRFAASAVAFIPAAAGLLWQLFDRDKLALHDRLSSTRVVKIPKKIAKQR